MQVKDKQDKDSEEYILHSYKKSSLGATFDIILLIIFITAVAIMGVIFDVW